MAEIYRTTSGALTDPFNEEKAKDVLDATKQAGRELVESMKVAPETMARIRQPLVDTEIFTKMGNMFWKSCIAEGVTPKKFQEEEMIPRPDCLENFMLIFPLGLNSAAAGGGAAA